MDALTKRQTIPDLTHVSDESLLRLAAKGFPIVLFLAAFLPRAVDVMSRSTVWHSRAIRFMEAVATQQWHRTLQGPHPGVTTMWLAGIAHSLGRLLVSDYNDRLLAYRMGFELVPLAFVTALCIVLAYYLLAQLTDSLTAALAAMLLALDPFHMSISKTLHVDAPVSIFMLVSALYMLIVVNQAEPAGRLRPVLLSGFFAGLALLSKSPALFLLPYLLLTIGLWQASEWLVAAGGVRRWRPQAVDWRRALVNVVRIVIPWLAMAALTYVLLWPSMWVQPLKSIADSLGKAIHHTANPHPNLRLFLGEVSSDDPGPLFYPVIIAIKTTAVSLPGFVLSLIFLFDRHLPRRRRLTIALMLCFLLFFVIQMSLGEKKAARYILPAVQFVTILAAFGLVAVGRRLARARQTLLFLFLGLAVVVQFAVSIPRHPYYGTHYNFLFGGPQRVLGQQIVPGQEQGEGLDLAAAYLNDLPLAPTLVVGAHVEKSFWQYFQGKTVPLTDDKVDYMVFSRNWVMRDLHAAGTRKLWRAYRDRQPKFVAQFDGVPYAWVFKVAPEIDDAAIGQPIGAQIGSDVKLLGYELNPTRVAPGDMVQLTLYWEALRQPRADLTVFTHLLGPTGQIYGQSDSRPQRGLYPTYLWDAGERVRDEYEIQVAADAAPGRYAIAIGMYVLQTLERQPIVMATGEMPADGRLLLEGPEVMPLNQR